MNQMKTYKRHSFRWGGDFRWMLTDSRTDSNPRGSFVFTGLYTGYYATPGAGTRSTGTGLDFADFLLGMSQQATLQVRPGHDPVPVARVEPVLPGRLARERASSRSTRACATST